MSILTMMKEGGSLVIDTIGNKPIDEDIDLLPDTSGFDATLLFTTYRIFTGTNALQQPGNSVHWVEAMGFANSEEQSMLLTGL
tara:strand:- start:213 stop:461 length:249 start_codon:yes stop_codon:yes gene_type:complete